jgi:hypothetical protein
MWLCASHVMKSKAIFVYTVLAVFLISVLLADSHDGFMLLSMISMGFFWGFMANEKFFRE